MNVGRYSGLVTALAVLIIVIYTECRYDLWDIFLGVIGFILALKYKPSITKSDRFFTFLVSSLFAISTVAILYGIIDNSTWFKELIVQTPFKLSFRTFLYFTVILSVVFHLTARDKEEEP